MYTLDYVPEFNVWTINSTSRTIQLWEEDRIGFIASGKTVTFATIRYELGRWLIVPEGEDHAYAMEPFAGCQATHFIPHEPDFEPCGFPS